MDDGFHSVGFLCLRIITYRMLCLKQGNVNKYNPKIWRWSLPQSKNGAGNKQKPEYICPYTSS